MGRDVVIEICKRDGRHFVSDCPVAPTMEQASGSADIAFARRLQTVNEP
jgi:hypothetical protein